MLSELRGGLLCGSSKTSPFKRDRVGNERLHFLFLQSGYSKHQVSFSTDKNFPANLVTISGKRAFEVISMNKKGMKPDSLLEEEKKP